MVVTRYESLRTELQEVQQEFEFFSARYIPLFHDLIWSPVCQDWDDEGYNTFIEGNRQATGALCELWELWPNRAACSRFWGYGKDSLAYLPQFKKLADRGYHILKELQRLPKNMNDPFSATLATFAEHNWGCYGWVELVSEWGMRFPTTRLQSDNGWWQYGGPVNNANVNQIALTYPSYLSMRLNVFESSAEFINLCLDPDSSIWVGSWDGLPGIVLPEPIPLPDWQAHNGELWFQGHLIKRFVKGAPNQRQVLDAFQQQQWRMEIENPFRMPQHSVKTAAEVLSRTVDGLNEDHKKKNLLRFGVKSMGDVVYWE